MPLVGNPGDDAQAPEKGSPDNPLDRWRRTIGLFLGPALTTVILLLPIPALTPEAHRLAALLALVIVFWVSEAIPIPATALLGAALAIVLGIAPVGTVFNAFGDPVIFLFIGSFILVRGMQVHRMDRRIAFALLAHPWVGASTYRTIWALGLTAWLLSMWMSNTATVAMLFPVALAVAAATSDVVRSAAASRLEYRRYSTGLLLMLAYAGSIGGIATPIGSPPNLIGISLIDRAVGLRIEFLQWMAFALPLAVVLLGLCYLIIMIFFRPEVGSVPGQVEIMQQAHRSLGPWTRGQVNSLIAFGTAVILWLGPGLLGLVLGGEHPLVVTLTQRLPEGVAALLAASLLFLLPVDWSRRQFTLTWPDAVRIDWGTVVLFGGGIALGRMMFDTGLAAVLGQGLIAALGADSPALLTAAAVGAASLISETSSNTASANVVVPVMLGAAPGGVDAAAGIAIAATLGASMGFMFPVSTPPNAIVYGSGAIRMIDMVRAGIALDIGGGVVVWLVSVWLVPLVLRLT